MSASEKRSRQPVPAHGEPGDVVEMGVDVGAAGAQRVRIGAALPVEPAEDLLLDQVAADLAPELALEPADEPPHLGALERGSAEQRGLGMHLLQKLGDGEGIADRGAVLGQEHRDLAGRIEAQEGFAPLPRFLQLQLEFELLLRQLQADLARRRRERMMEQLQHRGDCSE